LTNCTVTAVKENKCPIFFCDPLTVYHSE
jgi:hypothetical protein